MTVPAQLPYDSLPDVDLILNSHCHGDHVAGNALFPDAVCHLHEADAPGLGGLDAMMEIYGFAGSDTDERFRRVLVEQFLEAHHDSRPLCRRRIAPGRECGFGRGNGLFDRALCGQFDALLGAAFGRIEDLLRAPAGDQPLAVDQMSERVHEYTSAYCSENCRRPNPAISLSTSSPGRSQTRCSGAIP